MVRIFICFIFFCSSLSLSAQGLFSISGQVKDKKGETLPGAGIYLSGYTTATVTNNDGKFTLPALKPGSYEVVIQMMGFLPYSKSILITDQSASFTAILSENTIQLQEVTIKADPNRAKNLKLFLEFFIGRTPNSAQCKLLNPQILFIEDDRKEGILRVSTNDFLIVENKALGYRLKYMLNLFEYDFNTRIIYFSGLPVFEDLKGSGSKRKKWLQAREIAYAGSPQHFFQSLYKNQIQQEGFILYKRVKTKNPDRPADSVIQAAKERLVKRIHGPLKAGSALADSLSYWQQVQQMPAENVTLDMRGVQTDTLVKTAGPDLKFINYTDELYVLFTPEQESNAYSSSGHYILRPLTIPNYQISVIRMLKGPVGFYANGGMRDSRALLYEGFWAYEKIGDMVPMDYIPLAK